MFRPNSTAGYQIISTGYQDFLYIGYHELLPLYCTPVNLFKRCFQTRRSSLVTLECLRNILLFLEHPLQFLSSSCVHGFYVCPLILSSRCAVSFPDRHAAMLHICPVILTSNLPAKPFSPVSHPIQTVIGLCRFQCTLEMKFTKSVPKRW